MYDREGTKIEKDVALALDIETPYGKGFLLFFKSLIGCIRGSI